MKTTLLQVLRLLPENIKYRVVLYQPINNVISTDYLEVQNIKEYLNYEVAMLEKDFTIIIKGLKIA